MDKNKKDIFQYALAAVMVIGYFVILGMLVFNSLPIENKDAVNILLGILSMALGTVVGYFFGSSKGSSEKNDMLSVKKDEAPKV